MKACVALLLASGSLLVSQFASADGASAPSAPSKSSPAHHSRAKAANGQSNGCEHPFLVDQHGIKRLKPHCLAPATSAAPLSAPLCKAPVTASGRKEMLDCSQPICVDQHGIKRLKPQCL
jgi:hypothetical protein